MILTKSKKISNTIKKHYKNGVYDKRIGGPRVKIGDFLNNGKSRWDITVSGIEFDSAHWLECTKTPCDAIHGHRWKLDVEITSYKLDENGMVINFSTLKKWIKEITEKLDHNIINRYLEQPTAENLSQYIYHCLRIKIRNFCDKYNKIRIKSVKIFETPNNWCIYTYTQHQIDYKKMISKKILDDWKNIDKSTQRVKKMKISINNNYNELIKRSERMKGELNPMNSREIVEKMMNSLQLTLKNKEPNKDEQKLISIFSKNKLPFIFVGCGEKIIDGKCPDFINEELKLIIEYNGTFWHTENNWYNTKNTTKERYLFFKKRGYKTLFLTSEDLERGEIYIVKRVQTFLNVIRDFDVYE
jgi:6-pyruvoyltetrahydropterin/6-carboxytetrahydropterin synthase